MSAAQSSLPTHWIGCLDDINSSGQNHPQENCFGQQLLIRLEVSPFDHMGKDITRYANCQGAHVHIYNDVGSLQTCKLNYLQPPMNLNNCILVCTI
ncbi:hypothetical protein V6Z12_D04G032700 [Gossypium hirsutum]